MTHKQNPTGQPEAAKGQQGEFGEGNYKASQDYRERTERFVAEHGDEEIEAEARDAAEALDSDEGEELRDAEEAAKARSAE